MPDVAQGASAAASTDHCVTRSNHIITGLQRNKRDLEDKTLDKLIEGNSRACVWKLKIETKITKSKHIAHWVVFLFNPFLRSQLYLVFDKNKDYYHI